MPEHLPQQIVVDAQRLLHSAHRDRVYVGQPSWSGRFAVGGSPPSPPGSAPTRSGPATWRSPGIPIDWFGYIYLYGFHAGIILCARSIVNRRRRIAIRRAWLSCWSSGSSSFMALITSDPRLSTGPRMARLGSRSGGSGVLRLLVPPAPPGGLVRQRTMAHVDGRRAGRRWIRGAGRVRARGRACPRRPVPPLLRGPARPRVHGVALGPPTRRAGGRRSPAAGRCRSPRPDMAAGRGGCAGGSPSAPRRRAGTTWRRRPARRWCGRSARPARLARRPAPGAATDIGLLGDAGM